jgi:hypothetical protein
MSPRIAAECDNLGQDFSYRMRYQGNALKVWFTPTASMTGGLDKPLAEAPVPKDKWVSTEAVVLTYPPMPDQYAQKSAELLFGGRSQERYDDPEVQGGRIALIALFHNIVEKPPDCLHRMHASLPKQVAYSQRVLSAENEKAGINCSIGEFLSQMSASPDDQVIICVNAGESLKRYEQHLAGQLSLQSDRQMTATNVQFDGMSNDATSVTLTAVAEAVEWSHVLETCLPSRITQRVVICPPSLSKLETVLVTGNIGLDIENGHDIAYHRILSACALTKIHRGSSLPIRKTSKVLTLPTKFKFGCILLRRFQLVAGNKFSKM